MRFIQMGEEERRKTGRREGKEDNNAEAADARKGKSARWEWEVGRARIVVDEDHA